VERVPNDSGNRGSPIDACARIRDRLARGAPWDACDAFRSAIATQPADPELLFCGALAHARAGATREAHALLDRAQAQAPSRPLTVEIQSLRGRLWKDRLHRHPDGPDAASIAERARHEYLAAYGLQKDAYPGINAATLSMILGERAEARQLASEIADGLAKQATTRTCWEYATAGEAELLLGQIEAARQSYSAAAAHATADKGSIATMRRQVRLLARVIPEAVEVLAVLPATDVVAFAGHMIDAPGRVPPRFPATLEPAVRTALRAHLARLRDPVVYSSAACGGDLIFIEAALDVGAEVNIVLPFDRLDFVRTSVAVAGEAWVKRFDAALSRAARVFLATEEGYLDDDVLFEYAALLLEGLAVLRASQLETVPSLLCLIDGESTGDVGGTRSSFERWKRQVGAPQVIDLGALRERAEVAADACANSRPIGGVDAASPDSRPHRTLKTLLFADFAGFSRLHDAYAPLFQRRFLDVVANEIDRAPVKPLDSKTWGDGLYIVFESPGNGAEFALRLQTSMRAVDWKAAGLSETSGIRIALHAGPVFRGFDPIVKRDGFFGSNVTRTARIEPVTPPGMVYASEAFAALLTASGSRDYALEYVGQLALAKNYGESRIYRLERR
jgi:class 3 adenylate cyclase